jgi:hypothetical protein
MAKVNNLSLSQDSLSAVEIAAHPLALTSSVATQWLYGRRFLESSLRI